MAFRISGEMIDNNTMDQPYLQLVVSGRLNWTLFGQAVD